MYVKIACVLAMVAGLFNVQAAEISGDAYKNVIFKDDFSGEKLGKQWKFYKSESKIADGVMVGLMPVDADHASVNSLVLPPFSDAEVSLKFKFEGSPIFTVAFNDSKYKGSHAGHICRVAVNMKQISLRDGKTGIFNNEIWAKKKAGKLDEESKAILKASQKVIPYKFQKGKWYSLKIRIQGDVMQVSIDDKVVGSFQSKGIAHSTKNKPAIVVAKQAMHFDDLVIKTP
ncbi:MAG: DUF1080 domain-containing protein [Lentisphaeraceae bacterium]|nr:DUF1080 domain-containing protein [Lentisphaeraceae bacterium]